MTEHKATEKEKEALEKYLLQFLNLEKHFPLLPGIENKESVAGLMGLSVEELQKLRKLFAENAKESALELLKEEDVIEWVDQIPFEKNDTIVAFGDSSTDDLQGWFEIFKNVLDITVEGANFTFINAGLSYNTTSEALRRMNRDVLSHEPDWVIVNLGTFDAIRPSFMKNRTLIPLSESWENLSMIEDAIGTVTENPPVWITPTAIIPGLLDEMEYFDFDIDDRDLASVREVITGKKGYIVDPLGHRMGNPPEAWYFLSDGINPSLSGHVNTVKELLKSLATAKVRE
ncbi:SGNH/GDSL hydrolase family protein [Rhodohalobacter sp. 614A]|uniref:SGNH/GDSL hydrolase family protein n=1 Tax=Rhodohalobacter sp. 614A TaxID=2908649 RepID=UPI001F45EDA7|nr:SGNH/GDSL hydrolase family protein [Rhodohalobacter sp. 614A]